MLKRFIYLLTAVLLLFAFSGCNLVSNITNASPKNSSTPAETKQEEVTVTNVDEFIKAIGPNKKIIMKEGVYNLSAAKDISSNRYLNYYKETLDDEGRKYDVSQLEVYNIKNTTFEGSGNVVITSKENNTDTLELTASSKVTFKNITIRCDKTKDSVYGDGLSLANCTDIDIDTCKINGYSVGLYATSCENIKIISTNIYETGCGIVTLDDVKNAELNECTFTDNETWEKYGFFELSNKSALTINSSSFKNNRGTDENAAASMFILKDNSDMVLNKCDFENNTGLIFGAESVTTNNCTYKNNSFSRG